MTTLPCLFSLEIIVKQVKLSEDVTTGKFVPAIAFKLGNVKTQLISFVDEKSLADLRKNAASELHLRLLCDENNSYQFSRGKSCLFVSQVDRFVESLKRKPLSIILLNVLEKDKPEHVGVSTLALRDFGKSLQAHIRRSGSKIPLSTASRHDLTLFSPLGAECGSVGCKVKISYLGDYTPVAAATLERHSVGTPHREEAKSSRSVVCQTEYEEESLKENSAVNNTRRSSNTNNNNNTREQINAGSLRRSDHRRSSASSARVSFEMSEVPPGVAFCPPPLFYEAPPRGAKNFDLSEMHLQPPVEHTTRSDRDDSARAEYLRELLLRRLEEDGGDVLRRSAAPSSRNVPAPEPELRRSPGRGTGGLIDRDTFPVLATLVGELSALLLGDTGDTMPSRGHDVVRRPAPRSVSASRLPSAAERVVERSLSRSPSPAPGAPRVADPAYVRSFVRTCARAPEPLPKNMSYVRTSPRFRGVRNPALKKKENLASRLRLSSSLELRKSLEELELDQTRPAALDLTSGAREVFLPPHTLSSAAKVLAKARKTADRESKETTTALDSDRAPRANLPEGEYTREDLHDVIEAMNANLEDSAIVDMEDARSRRMSMPALLLAAPSQQKTPHVPLVASAASRRVSLPVLSHNPTPLRPSQQAFLVIRDAIREADDEEGEEEEGQYTNEFDSTEDTKALSQSRASTSEIGGDDEGVGGSESASPPPPVPASTACLVSSIHSSTDLFDLSEMTRSHQGSVTQSAAHLRGSRDWRRASLPAKVVYS